MANINNSYFNFTYCRIYFGDKLCFDNVDALVNLFCTALIFIAIILILNIYGKILENEESTRIRLKMKK